MSLCSGIGGLDLGLGLAVPSARTVCYVENEATNGALLVSRMEEGTLDLAPIWSDLRTFNGLAWRGKVHCIIAGYPCQPFSSAGKRRGRKDPRHLWPHVARIIREVEPEIVFIENVSNHLKLGFREVAQELRRMGYRVRAGIYSAENVGAPHLRKRLFAMAEREGRGCGERREPSALERFIDWSGAELDYSNLGGFADQNGGAEAFASGNRKNNRVPRSAGDDVANAERKRRDSRIEQTLLRRRLANGKNALDGSGEPHGSHEEMANAGGRFVPDARRRAKGRTGTRSTGEALANSSAVFGETFERDQSNRVLPIVGNASGRQREQLRRAGASSRSTQRQGLLGSRSSGGDMGNASRERMEGMRAEGISLAEETTREALSRCSINRVFCPGPSEREEWAELLRILPEAEPALCRDVDGLSARVDRLRGLGNGVVPLVAGLAFISLARSFVPVRNRAEELVAA